MIASVAAFLMAVLLTVAVWVVRRGRETDRGSFDLGMELMDEIAPVTQAVYAGREPSPEALERAAADPRTRNTLFGFLLYHHRTASFPARYRTAEAFAESALVQWLMHPNELGVAPDEIELVDEVRDPAAEKRNRWLVFRFRTMPPHWAAGDGWMAGVVGPMSAPPLEPFPDARVVWSMFRPIDSASAEAHVAAIRELARKAGIAV